ncbi:MAG: hypothetical protein OXU61_01180 [Gammaproteobacteria bacterium]|nr:hypothetical protein [Gammaproteobacteria bacterium]
MRNFAIFHPNRHQKCAVQCGDDIRWCDCDREILRAHMSSKDRCHNSPAVLNLLATGSDTSGIKNRPAGPGGWGLP